MSQLIFQSVSGGSVTLNGPNTAGTYNLAIPAANGTLLYQDLSGLVTFNNVTITGLLSLTGTSALGIPVGNTVQRPAAPVAGDIRYNTDGGGLYEGYLPAVSAWYKFSMVPEGQYTISYMIVAGGGGAADVSGTLGSGEGGGGAGGLATGTITALPSTSFTIVIGGGGSPQNTGSNSYISGIQTAYGGGGGNGGAGGSGGGGVGGGSGQPGGGVVAAGQGNAGGDGNGFQGSGGGGGGAGAAGQNGTSIGGNGGAGASNTLTGTTVYYAGGGAGCGPYPGNTPGSGGTGGGAANGGNGTVNTGGGGGAARGAGGNGGSGIVVISMPTSSYTGTVTGLPTVTTVGSNTVLQYTQSGTYTA